MDKISCNRQRFTTIEEAENFVRFMEHRRISGWAVDGLPCKDCGSIHVFRREKPPLKVVKKR